MKKIKVIELFSGVGSQAMALRNLELDYQVVGISEIDKFAVQSYEAIHGKVNNFGDISKIEELPYCDLLTYSFPCQDLSVSGKQMGIRKGTRSGLLLEVERLLRKAKANGTLPKYLLLENVKNLVGKKFIRDFERWLDFLHDLGYYNFCQVLNAKDYGIPQNRERVFVLSSLENINYKFPEKQELKKRMKDLLENSAPEKYFLTEKALKSFMDSTCRNGFIRSNKFRPVEEESADIASTLLTSANDRVTDNFIIQLGNLKQTGSFGGNPQVGRVYDSAGLSPCLTTMQGGGLEPKILQRGRGYNKGGMKNFAPALTTSSWQENNFLSNIGRIRKLTPLECWRLMGFSDKDFYKAKNAGISDTQLYKQAGNSIVVQVLEGIFSQLFLVKHEKRKTIQVKQLSLFGGINEENNSLRNENKR